MKGAIWFSLGIIVLSFLVGIVLFEEMPSRMDSHWNSKGDADGEMSKFWGLFLIPIISLLLFLLMLYLPKIDPKGRNIEKFRDKYESFVFALTLFLFFMYLMTIAWNLGYKFNFTYLMIPALAALFFFVGSVIEETKQNWFIGIRTPWTLSSEFVWNETHKWTGKWVRIVAIVSLVSLLFPKNALWIAVFPLIVVFFAGFIYSYFVYRSEKK